MADRQDRDALAEARSIVLTAASAFRPETEGRFIEAFDKAVTIARREGEARIRAAVEARLAELDQWVGNGPGRSTPEQVEAFEKGLTLAVERVRAALADPGDALAHVKAEAGAKALRDAGNRENMPHRVQAFATPEDRCEIAAYLDARADRIAAGADEGGET